MNFNKILESITDLRETKGTNAKREKLTEMFKNPELEGIVSLFQYAYDPLKAYYRTSVVPTAFPRMLSRSAPCDFEYVLETLDDMNDRTIGGKTADSQLAKSLINLGPDALTITQMILDRDFKTGVAEKGINHAWKAAGNDSNLIDILPYHRYNNMTIEALKRMDFKRGVYSQLKSDGMFANIVVRHNGVTVRSRSGSPLIGESIDSLANCFTDILGDTGLPESVFHGELLVVDNKENKILPRAVGNGKLNKIIQKGILLEERYSVIFRVWDVIPYENWISGETLDVPYERRFSIIQDLFDVGEDESSLITVQETRIVHSFEEAVEHFKSALARGEEGTIVKAHFMKWINGDSNEGMKLKMEIEVELEIVGLVEGDKKGKHAGTFGSLRCKSGDDLLWVNVSGLSDALRDEIFNNQADYMNGIITVRSNGVQDKTDSAVKSLFLPRYIERRLDKKEANTLPEIYDIQKSYVDNILKLLEQ